MLLDSLYTALLLGNNQAAAVGRGSSFLERGEKTKNTHTNKIEDSKLIEEEPRSMEILFTFSGCLSSAPY